MAQTKPPIFDVIDIEREIEEEFRKLPSTHESQSTDFAPPSVSAPDLSMPDYVEHRAGATEIGKLSAEAVVREYEAAAKDIEDLGVELVGHVKQCEAMKTFSLNKMNWNRWIAGFALSTCEKADETHFLSATHRAGRRGPVRGCIRADFTG